ncbi:MAG: hypothetical protein QNJ46_16105 [Leptolyngbyaceae cyanobacterium MO_188.B28]|nr:hypothetical protein [Leptolyngbyaceae cyanobacterium MO_188.B28]
MEISEFRERYRDAQVRFRNSLQTITIAIEILEAVGSFLEVKSALNLICKEIPRLLEEYNRLDRIVEEYISSQEEGS